MFVFYAWQNHQILDYLKEWKQNCDDFQESFNLLQPFCTSLIWAFAAPFLTPLLLCLGLMRTFHQLVVLFHFNCTDILDSVAPHKIRRPKTQPCLNSDNYFLWQKYRRVRKKYRNKTSSLKNFYNFFSTKVLKNICKKNPKHFHSPKVLFNTINAVINPAHLSQRPLGKTVRFLKVFYCHSWQYKVTYFISGQWFLWYSSILCLP